MTNEDPVSELIGSGGLVITPNQLGLTTANSTEEVNENGD